MKENGADGDEGGRKNTVCCKKKNSKIVKIVKLSYPV